ncbi:hypothetical protein [Brucella sp. NBRC 12950]|uniref:hypothetical protein n=1 Tax=Brucella sp. NBRC 12950 TaxID=2994518 RepID=UPI002554B747|nr:hypothetical protein [Brucella sp. NBRC 12950]
MKCPKCGNASGDDWSQCEGGCPIVVSPYYDEYLVGGYKANVSTYDDWFPDLSIPIAAEQQGGHEKAN